MASRHHPAVAGQLARSERGQRSPATDPEAPAPGHGGISCRGCVRRATEACSECPVSMLVGAGRDVALDRDDVIALNRLAAAGMVPHLKYLAAA